MTNRHLGAAVLTAGLIAAFSTPIVSAQGIDFQAQAETKIIQTALQPVQNAKCEDFKSVLKQTFAVAGQDPNAGAAAELTLTVMPRATFEAKAKEAAKAKYPQLSDNALNQIATRVADKAQQCNMLQGKKGFFQKIASFFGSS